MKGISFVIRTLNEGLYLKDTLESISCQNNDNFEVIIVDSGSTDNTKEIASSFGCKIVNIKKEEWSWGKALNLGISYAIYDNVCIISGHCILTNESFIDVAFQLLEQSNVVYGRQVPIDNFDPFEEYELNAWYPKSVKINNSELIKVGKGVGVSNACCILNKKIWFEFKYNETLQSMEDAEWAYRVALGENMIIYTSLLSVYHSHKFNSDYTYRKWYCRQYEGYVFLNKSYNIYNVDFFGIVKFLMSDIFRFIKLPIEIVKINSLLNNRYTINKTSFLGYFLIRNLAIHNAFFDYAKNKPINYWGVDSKVLKTINRYFKMSFKVK